jgi:hypothetical protein
MMKHPFSKPAKRFDTLDFRHQNHRLAGSNSKAQTFGQDAKSALAQMTLRKHL